MLSCARALASSARVRLGCTRPSSRTRIVSGAESRRRIVMSSGRKPGVASDEEFDAFLAAAAGRNIVVVDARNPDFSIEADDAKFGADGGSAPISQCGTPARPNAMNIPFEREAKRLQPQGVEALEAKTGGDKTTPIVTHCGGGGRGQKAKEALEAMGYSNVVNGGGPAVAELWTKFGSL
mmetsp:Transcript_6211/g.22405  ORF Transcript_6211/g.22405 Transcript_6211/m.22405 type:complete len:180 (+) Transcript_6211:2391-2930(+)